MGSARQTHLNQALMSISRRAESVDRYTLATTYVEVGSFSAVLNSTDHQILYGRRGAGKTHALLYLSDLVENAGDVFVYVDLRTIGSAGGLYADSTLSLADRGAQLLVDTLETIHEELLTVAVERAVPDQNGLLRALDALGAAATAVEVVGETQRETSRSDAAETNRQVSLTVSARPALTASANRRGSVSVGDRVLRTGTERHHVLFGPLYRALRAVAESIAPARLWLLLDEWSSIPLELQPLLADLVRRGILPVNGITVKIAAIERRSRFFVSGRDGVDYLGIEVGADAASAVSLDDFMIFDHAWHRAEEFFRRLFYNHASAKLAKMGDKPPADAHTLIVETFRGHAFAELVRAAEGIPRDAINIAALAAQHANDESIGLAEVRRAARDWYLRDKQTAINTNTLARRMLQLIVDEVVGNRKSRTFVVEQSSGSYHEGIDTLYDARLLHVLRRGIVDRHRPGRVYDGFAIDYGCYVALLLEDGRRVRVRDKGNWLTSPKSVPDEDFSLSRMEVDLSTLKPD